MLRGSSSAWVVKTPAIWDSTTLKPACTCRSDTSTDPESPEFTVEILAVDRCSGARFSRWYIAFGRLLFPRLHRVAGMNVCRASDHPILRAQALLDDAPSLVQWPGRYRPAFGDIAVIDHHHILV